MAQDLITQAEYARRRGVSPAAVHKAIVARRISGVVRGGRVMIDAELADIEWARNTDADQQQRGAPDQFAVTQRRAEQALRGGGDLLAGVDAPAAPPGDDAQTSSESAMLVDAKTTSEQFRAALLELELEERLGTLVRVSEVERIYASKLVAAREALEAIPDRLAAKLAATSDAERAHAMLAEEIRSAMLHLAPKVEVA